ncbi:MAG: hypothetical protein WD645_04710 [Dehalococcoidia bacterium]
MADSNHPDSKHNEALEEAMQTVSALGPIRQLAEELRTYPVALLRQVCAEQRRRGGPVPDHVLSLPPYIGETALRALMDGGLVERVDDQQFAIHAYRPTGAGQALVDRIEAGGDGGQQRPRKRGKPS